MGGGDGEEDEGAVWFGAYGATPQLSCGGRFGRHTCGARSVARCGAVGHKPNTPLKCAKAAEGVRTGRATILYGLSLFQVSS